MSKPLQDSKLLFAVHVVALAYAECLCTEAGCALGPHWGAYQALCANMPFKLL